MEHQRYHNQLRRFRRERCLTQKEVAEIMGLRNSAMISRWEKGTVLPETVNALKMAALYRSSVDVIYRDLRLSVMEKLIQREEVIKTRWEDHE